MAINIYVIGATLGTVLFMANASFANEKPVESAAGSTAAAVSERKLSKPRFEFGVAGAGLQVPAYPGSAVVSDRLLAAPWLIYRSDKLQVKDGGVELVAYESDNLTIDLGIGASLNADTSETPLRSGMPDLDYLLELGPRFNVPLSDKTVDGIRTRWDWTSALRFALSTDFSRVDYRGPVVNTQLRYRVEGFNNNKLSFNATATSTWLGDELMDYFYSVDEEFATPTRPQFDAESGFLSLGLSAGIGYKPIDNLNTFLGLGYTSLSGSRNDDSPLFEDESNPSVIFAVSWRIYKSKRMVQVRDE